MSTTREVRAIVKKQGMLIDKLIEKAEGIKKMPYIEEKKRELLADVDAERRYIEKQAIEELKKACHDLKVKIYAKHIPKGEEITPDAQIFQQNVSLSRDELSYYIEKYKDNYTMGRIIKDYADNNNIELSINEVSMGSGKLEEKLNRLDALYNYSINSLGDAHYRSMIFDNDDNFNKILGTELINE